MKSDKYKPASHTVSWATRNKDKSKNNLQLQAGDLFDRVINLKFITSEQGGDGVEKYVDEFVLRSDYELVDAKFVANVANGTVSYSQDKKISCIRKCRLKPSVKVQYKQVAGNTAIELDIFVQNFFMLDSEGKTLMSFSNTKGRLASVEIQMGYFGQFADFFKGNENGVPTLEQYFDFTEKPEGVQTITCNVTYCQTDKLPPDSTMHIHGFVGSCYTQPVTDKMITDDNQISSIELSTVDTSSVYMYQKGENAFRFKSFAHYLYNNVTRRFFRNKIPATNKKEVKNLKIKFKDGGVCLDDDSSLKYGVRVFLSEGIVGDGKSDVFLGKQQIYDSDGKPLKGKKSSEFTKELSGDTPMKALNSFSSFQSSLFRVQPLENGDYLLFLNEEMKHSGKLSEMNWYTFDPKLGKNGVDLDGDGEIKASELGLVKFTYDEILKYVNDSLGGKAKNADIFGYGALKGVSVGGEKLNINRIPAVYNIAYDNALCTITCPFFYFLTPFQKFYFASRYAVSSMIAYYLDQENKEMEFTMIWQSVSFATVENINDVQICCVPTEAK